MNETTNPEIHARSVVARFAGIAALSFAVGAGAVGWAGHATQPSSPPPTFAPVTVPVTSPSALPACGQGRLHACVTDIYATPTTQAYPYSVDVVDANCEEDEVVAVQRDTDPTHALTWYCVNAEEYVEAFNAEQ